MNLTQVAIEEYLEPAANALADYPASAGSVRQDPLRLRRRRHRVHPSAALPAETTM